MPNSLPWVIDVGDVELVVVVQLSCESSDLIENCPVELFNDSL